MDDPRITNAIEQFNIYEFLDEHSVSYSLEGKNIGGNYIGIEVCPNCSRGDFHSGIHKHKLFMTCFVCKFQANIIKVISIYSGMSYKVAKKYLIDNSENNLDVVQMVQQIVYSKKPKREYNFDKIDLIPKSRRITINDINTNPYIKEFFKNRKLNIWHCHWYDLRISPLNEHKGHIFFPVYLNGEIVTYQWRTLLGKTYHNSENLGSYLLNENRVIPNKPLILVEGYLDFTRVDSFIRCFYKDKIAVTSGMVKSVSQRQIQRITHIKPSKLIAMLDNDSWFDYRRLEREIPFDVDHVILPKGKDPNELSWKELHIIFKGLNIC